jgi:hypothetical protein
MYRRAVQKLSEGKDWLYEVKSESYRCLADLDWPDAVVIASERSPIDS